MKRIDFESHYYIKEFFTASTNRAQIPVYDPLKNYMYHGGDGILPIQPIVDLLLDLTDTRIKYMNASGIDIAVLSFSLGIEQFEPSIGIPLAKLSHNVLYEGICKNPDRFRGNAVLAVDDIESSLYELERCNKDLGFIGWNAFSNYHGKHLDDIKFFPLLKKACDLGMYVFIHPTVSASQDIHGYGPAMVTSGFGFAFDVATCLTRMIFCGIFDLLPDLKIIVSHMGESLPFLLQRMDDAYERLKPVPNKAGNSHAPSTYFQKNIWISTSGNFSAPAFQCAKDVVGTDRMIFGTDYPMESMSKNVEFLDSQPISVKEARKIYFENAEQYFGF